MPTPRPRTAACVTMFSALLMFTGCAGDEGERVPGEEAREATAPDTAAAAGPGLAISEENPIERGRYLTTVGGCHDCHTPKTFTGGEPVPDTTRLLAGHPADAAIAAVPWNALAPEGWSVMGNAHATAWAGPWGVSYAINLTPDSTGLGTWTVDQFVQAMRTGRHMGAGRPILPPMPWRNVGSATDADLEAIFAYLQSIPPVQNRVPAPIPPGGQPPGGG